MDRKILCLIHLVSEPRRASLGGARRWVGRGRLCDTRRRLDALGGHGADTGHIPDGDQGQGLAPVLDDTSSANDFDFAAPDFLDREGQPLILPVEGDPISFEKLCSRYAGDIPGIGGLRR